MKNFKKLLILALTALTGLQSQAQYMTGCEIDTVLAKKTPQKAVMTRDISNNLPAAVSLQKFTPIPGDQGQTGTCTAWSSTYCIATMIWAMKNGITNRAKITKNAFLPCYTYANILRQSTTNCAAGTDIADACAWLKNTGAVKLSLYSQSPACIASNQIPTNWKSLAAQNKILNYTKLFFNYNNLAMKVTSTKTALAAGHPVLAAFKCPNSMAASTGINSNGEWWPTENSNYNYGGHALAVVAYDDNKLNGGAFLVQNSWGTNWGKKGYFWCSYYTYACWCYYAYEISSDLNGVTVDKTTANLNFSTSLNEADYGGGGGNVKPDDNNPKPNNNDKNYVLVDEDFLKKIADQYGINYKDFIKNKGNNNNGYNDNNYNNGYNDNNYNNGYNDNNYNNGYNDNNYDYDYNYDYNDNDDYADYSDNDYNYYYNDNDDNSWNGYTDNDYTDYDYNYYNNNNNNNYYYYYTNSSYKDNIEKSKEEGVVYDEDNTYDKNFCKTKKLHIKTPDGKNLEVSKFSGNIKLMLNDNTLMTGKINGKVIEISKSYKGGTRFRVYVGNNQPAYVYVFGSDLTNKTYHIFPQSRLTSPYLDYVNSRVAFPDEKHYIEMDNQKGTDYLYVLYSLVPLNIDKIEQKMEEIKGDYENKLFDILGPKTFSLAESESSGERTFRFNAMSVKKETLGVVIKIQHE
ncbi:MAG: DUF4384 domain-containing protein [Bacteroidales bacterium]|nr:DUF4384 domain-containing protein [Bacteroidales bacterium]